uniref:Uteroglobin n=2 Tax=Bos TaxID=9903 RepID=A0A4W2FJC9_BOBOX
MKLTIAIVLVTLTLFCRPASTEVCPSLLYVLGNLIAGTPSSYEATLEPFSPDEDMKEATSQLKTLIDTLSPKAKDSVLELMVHGSLHNCCPHPWAAVSSTSGHACMLS